MTLPGCVRQTFGLFFSGGQCDNPEPMAAGHVAGGAFVPVLVFKFSVLVFTSRIFVDMRLNWLALIRYTNRHLRRDMILLFEALENDFFFVLYHWQQPT